MFVLLAFIAGSQAEPVMTSHSEDLKFLIGTLVEQLVYRELQSGASHCPDLDHTTASKLAMTTRYSVRSPTLHSHTTPLCCNYRGSMHRCQAATDCGRMKKLLNPGLYETLGFISPEEGSKATAEEIKVAFRSVAKLCHPDMPGGSETRMLEVLDAYEVLSNPELRQEYNMKFSKSRRSEPSNPFSEPDEEARYVFVHEVRCISTDVEAALSQAPDYFEESDRGSVRYRSTVGPVSDEDIQRVNGVVGAAFSASFHWVTGAQLAALVDMQEAYTAPGADMDYIALELDTWIAKAEFENGRWVPPERKRKPERKGKYVDWY